jgi:hypothetical protein
MLRLPIAFLLLTGAPLAQLQPATHESPSGLWRLHVDPLERSGTSGADYAMTLDGTPVWEARHPFTLWSACVTDEGRVGGYGYVGATASSWSGGRLDVVILSPDGEILLREPHERESSHFMHTPATPRARGLFAQHWFDQMVVRVVDEEADQEADSWWTYDLKSGTCWRRDTMRERLELEKEVRGCLAVREVPGTPLTLVHWLRFPRTVPTTRGSRFDLLDGQDQVVWTLELPEDFESERPAARAWREGGLLEVGPGRFDLWHFDENVAVSYELSMGAGGTWSVHETNRRPLEDDTDTPLAAPIRPERPRAIELGEAPPTPGPIRDVKAMGFDEDGNLRFVREEPDAWNLVRVDGTGAVLHEMPVTLPVENLASVRWFALPQGRWVATNHLYGKDPRTTAWLVEETDGEAVELPGLGPHPVSRIVALSKDECLVLADQVQRLHLLEKSSGPFAGSARDVAVTTEGKVVVLDDRGQALEIRSNEGTLLDTIVLEEAWGAEPRYPVRLVADAEEGVVVHDFNSELPLCRMSLDGTVRERFDARPASGPGLEEYRRELRFGPDGRMWTTDGHAIVLLDETGRAERSLGVPEDPTVLRAPRFGAIDSTFGRALVVDEQSRALHVFDAEGQRTLLGIPGPADLEPLRRPLRLGCDSRGGAWASTVRSSAGAVRFDPDGNSLGMTRLEKTAVFCPENEAFWGVREDVVIRRGGDRAALDLPRTPEGLWWRDAVDLAIAADGRLAVLDLPAMEGLVGRRAEGPGLVAWYDPDGEPLGQARVPPEVSADHLAFGGPWILLSRFGFPAWLVDTRDASLHPVEPPVDEEGVVGLGLSRDGSELWALNPSKRTLWRCALPR